MVAFQDFDFVFPTFVKSEPVLLCAAVLPPGIFGLKAHFGFVVLQVVQLLGIEGAVAFPSARVTAGILTASAQ